jgi:hypothetical protein
MVSPVRQLLYLMDGWQRPLVALGFMSSGDTRPCSALAQK